ncbi:sugar transferase [Caldicellulosiruptor morganii]|uniref:Exopolysaccharide biosynthesis polyprenyl glycosylphosphotransferase n=1 Tax=Caldicellulosiruptor morganii TaxID=1387555 RepID=A0ABY7BMB2_9FIRM|nr:exopolysaccharide biosynthesis polyprenyl glycosylphosphotransferase [Caldicellulosiruptor morganii]WAM33650.1 exopolysaccharide biosynthesis polyprenyl glycosylphosphotransferase [Caldicellulosiruptor morganii]
MIDELKAFRKIVYNFTSFISLSLSFCLGYKFRFGQKEIVFEKSDYKLLYVLIFIFLLLIAFGFSKELNTNKITVRNLFVLHILKRAGLIFVYVACISLVIKLDLSRIFIATFLIVYILLEAIFKIGLLKVEKLIFKCSTDYYIAVIGTKNQLKFVKLENIFLNLNKEMKTKVHDITIDNMDQSSYNAAIEMLINLVKNSIVDEVVILACDTLDKEFQQKVINICKLTGRRLKIIFRNEFGNEKVYFAAVDDKLIFELRPVETSTVYKFVKRLFDIILSAAALVLTSPLFLLIAILIKIDSPEGPVFFIQERIGLNGRRFKLIKFRTMIPDAEKRKKELAKYNEMDGPVFKITNDPRITRIGKILRKLSLDELPQLINVLKGEMSLVGPRPLPTSEGIECEIEHQIRHAVKPGLTCIWQVSGRNSVSYCEWMNMDKEYVMKRNLLLDIVLLLKTIMAVLKMTGR